MRYPIKVGLCISKENSKGTSRDCSSSAGCSLLGELLAPLERLYSYQERPPVRPFLCRFCLFISDRASPLAEAGLEPVIFFFFVPTF